MVEDNDTGEWIETKVLITTPSDIRAQRTQWQFQWTEVTKDYEVYHLVPERSPGTILGLIALRRKSGYVEVVLLVCHRSQVGRNKKFRGIAGKLLAHAAEISVSIGGNGYLTLDAKSELFDHYTETYGFQRVGSSQRMILNEIPAAELIQKFARRQGHDEEAF